MSGPKPSRLKVEFWEEGGLWYYDAPLVIGGGCKTMREAFRHCSEAIEFHGLQDSCQDHCPYGMACDCQELHGSDARKQVVE